MDGGLAGVPARERFVEDARTAVLPENQGAFPKKNDFLRCRGNSIAI